MARSVLRVADQLAGIYPERCVLSGVETSRAVRLTATQWGGRRWLLGVPGFALVAGRLPGHGHCPVALPVSERIWKMWRARDLAAMSTLAAAVTFVGIGLAYRRHRARGVRPTGRVRCRRLPDPRTSQLLGHVHPASGELDDSRRTDPPALRRRRSSAVHPVGALNPTQWRLTRFRPAVAELQRRGLDAPAPAARSRCVRTSLRSAPQRYDRRHR